MDRVYSGLVRAFVLTSGTMNNEIIEPWESAKPFTSLTSHSMVLRRNNPRKLRMTSELSQSWQLMQEPTLFDQHWAQLLKERIPCLFVKCSEKGQTIHVLNAITNNTKMPVYIYYRAHGFVDTQYRRPIAETKDFEAAISYAKRSFSQKVRKLFVFAELPPLDESKEFVNTLLIGIQHATLHHRSFILIGTQNLPLLLQDQTTTVHVDFKDNSIQLPDELPTRKTKKSIQDYTEQPATPPIEDQSNPIAATEPNPLSSKKHILGVERLSYHVEKAMGSRFGGLCQWLDKKRLYFKARNLRSPRGLLLLGTPGVNWEFAVKMIASTWKTSLYRFDLRVLQSLPAAEAVEHVNHVLGYLEMTQPCVAWIEHFEDVLQWHDPESTGKSSRVLIDLLYWFEKRESKVFVVLTANDIENLPQELFKMGHFDEMFYLTLPGIQERSDIILQQITRLKLPHPSEQCLEQLVALSNGMLIEEIVRSIELAAHQLRTKKDQNKIDLTYERHFTQRLLGGGDNKDVTL